MRKGAAISQEKEEYWLATAGVQVLLGQPAMARLALERAAGLAPDSPRVAAMRVQLELRATNGAEALRLAQELQARRADEPQVLLMLAQAQRMQGSLASSVETLEKLQARQPTSQTAALIYGIRREIDPATALKPLQEWLAKHPDDHTMQAMMADALMSAGQNAESIVAYEKLLALAPKNVIVLNNLAWLYYLEKDKRAIPTARRAYELAPQATNVADTYGWLLLESGANQEALEVLNKIYESGMLIDPEARYHHAAALARNGRQAEAREQLALLLDEAPQFPSRQAAVALAENVK
jgi:Flp pilus assembly protein TadD